MARKLAHDICRFLLYTNLEKVATAATAVGVKWLLLTSVSGHLVFIIFLGLPFFLCILKTVDNASNIQIFYHRNFVANQGVLVSHSHPKKSW